MIYNIRFHIYDFLLYLKSRLENKKESELGYYNKVVNNVTTSNGVKINHDLIASIKSRNAENIEDIIVSNGTINMFQIEKLRQRKEDLLYDKPKYYKEIKEFNKIMGILNINI